MKKYLLLIAFFVSVTATAQEYRRQLDRSMIGQGQGNKSKSDEKIDMVEISMKKLDEDLKLDSFQSAVIRQILEDQEGEQKKIIEEDIPNESKMEKLVALRLKMNNKIREILRPDQIEIFEKLLKKKGKK